MEQRNITEITYLNTECVYDDGEHIWFVEGMINALCFYDKKKSAIKLAAILPLKDPNIFKSHVKIIGFEHKVAILPWYGCCDIIIFDILSNSVKVIQLDETEVKPCLKFSGCFRYKKWIYFLGLCYPAIVRMHTDTYEINYIKGWINEIEQSGTSLDGKYLTEGIVLNNIGYFPLASAPMVLEYNFETEMFKIHRIKADYKGFNGLTFNKNYFWAVDRGKDNSKLAKLSKDFTQAWAIKTETQIPIDNIMFSKPVEYDGKIFLCPITEGKAYIYDLNSETLSRCPGLDEWELMNGFKNYYLYFLFRENEYLYFCPQNYGLIRYNIELDRADDVKIDVEDKIVDLILSKREKGVEIKNENNYHTLAMYLYELSRN